MMFTEVEFAFFLPAMLLLYWVGPRRSGWQNAVLLLGSLLFYASWQVRLVPLLLGSALIDFVLARYLDRTREDASAAGTRRAVLLLSGALSLGLLCLFKYAGFFAESLNYLLGMMGLRVGVPVLRLVLPLGLSFYTLQRLGYVIDVYYGRIAACQDLIQFLVFGTFFPQITAGPISRGSEFLPQLATARPLDPEDVAVGALAFLWGFMQKAFAADVIGRILVEPVFLAPGQYGVRAHWMGLVGYALQVFLDFAGYSLMALGCARLFGLRLPVNFNMPFLARSLFDFWRRWHITLNRWLFDYVYGPATTGQGFFRGRYAVGVLMVMLLSGLWHGAQWTFVSWGLFHGVGLMVNQRWLDYWRTLMRQDRKWKGVQQSAAYAGAALLLTQGWFLLSLVLFRSPDFGAAAAYFAGLLHGAGQALEVGGVNDKIELLLALLVAAGTHVRGVAWGSRMTEGFFKLPAPVRGIAYGLIIVLLCILTPVSSGAFIYRQF